VTATLPLAGVLSIRADRDRTRSPSSSSRSGNRLTKREEIEVVWIAHDLFRKIGLRSWQGVTEVGHGENPAIPGKPI
jgi:hypothetical protein